MLGKRLRLLPLLVDRAYAPGKRWFGLDGNPTIKFVDAAHQEGGPGAEIVTRPRKGIELVRTN